ncbi:MAG: hypothetical protein DSY37_02800 [Hyperthermus sp.]|nr:MAG: hypothetical protein DSY37_02800 [Hyperthermus sp.]
MGERSKSRLRVKRKRFEPPVLCEVCGVRRAERVCPLCGRMVCSSHYDEDRGICSLCAETLCENCGRNLSITQCPVCGSLVCSDCSVQLTPVVRICTRCASKRVSLDDIARKEVVMLAESLRKYLVVAAGR